MTSLSDSPRPTHVAAGRSIEESSGNILCPEPRGGMTWKQQARRIHREAQTFYFAFKHPGVHWYAKLVAAGTAGYLFSPVQLIPRFIPVIGLLDDFLVLFLVVNLLQRIIPLDVLAECREQAKAAEMRRKDETRSAAVAFTFLVVTALWLFVAIRVSRLIVAYVYR